VTPRRGRDPKAGSWVAVRLRERHRADSVVTVRDYPRTDLSLLRYYTREREKALRFDSREEALGFIRAWNRFPRRGLRLGAERIGAADS
jgi:hypothetical protein